MMKKGKYVLIAGFFLLNSLSNEPIISLPGIKNIMVPLAIDHFFIKDDFDPMKTSLLRRIPFSDDFGVVKDNFILDINDASFPYNPAACIEDNKIKVIFREDIRDNTFSKKFKTKLKCVYFDDSFKQISKSQAVIETSNTAEDPRLINFKNENCLVYNDLKTSDNSLSRVMYFKSSDQKPRLKLDLGVNNQEKNWAPFVYKNELHFVYKILPHVIVKLTDQRQQELQILENDKRLEFPKFWKWGEPRGGTPAILIGDEYLTFFHSSYKHKDKTIYVMGAYTFENKPPFSIKRFSKFPIIFKECYSAPLQNTADPNKKVIFPTGLISLNNKTYLFCGENDCAIRVLEIDLDSLLLIMNKI